MLDESHKHTIHTDVLKEVGRRGVGGPQTHHTHRHALRTTQGDWLHTRYMILE